MYQLSEHDNIFGFPDFQEAFLGRVSILVLIPDTGILGYRHQEIRLRDPENDIRRAQSECLLTTSENDMRMTAAERIHGMKASPTDLNTRIYKLEFIEQCGVVNEFLCTDFHSFIH